MNHNSLNIPDQAFIEIQETILEHDYREMTLLSKIMNNLYCLEQLKTSIRNKEYYPKNILEHINK